ncbi:TetR/AcrR family transcriptional regulator [Nocardia callitridis]
MTVDNRHPARSATSGESAPREVRRRPKNRRAQIAAASAAAFGSHGYHGVSMEGIAAELGISSAALYRHYPSKYSLFREELLRVGTAMSASAHLPEAAQNWSPRQRLWHILDTLIATAIDNRATLTLVRWEVRYLDPADLATLIDEQKTLTVALETHLGDIRPELSRADLRVLRASVLSVVTSIADHRATLPTKSLAALLNAACAAIVTAELPDPRPDEATVASVEIPDSFKHELLLHKSAELFHEHGYPNVSMDDIATAAGLSAASAVYRFYRGKSDLLAAAFRRGAEMVSGAIRAAVADSTDAEVTLTTLIEHYVARSFAERALSFVYYTEFQHVPVDERTVLRNIQRLSVEEWARLLREVRPELSPVQARIHIHAAFAMVVDLGRAFGNRPTASQERVRWLMRQVLFGV